MKKIILSLSSCAFLAVVGIGNDNVANAQDNGEQSRIAVTTTFLNDMVQVLEEDVEFFEVDLIIPAGEDPHVYSATASDVRTLTEAEFVLYQGLDFEGRMMDLLENGIAVADDLNADELEEMEEEDGELVVDPHFWFDLELFKEVMTNVKDTLVEYNPDGESQYEENLEAYFEQLDELDEYIVSRIEEIPEERRIVITPHDAFGYMASAYDLEVHAPQGFSTESEVSNQEISAIADLIIENEVPAIFVETTTNPDRMQRLKEIVESAGHDVEVVSGEDVALLSDSLAVSGSFGDNFIDMYTHNIDVIVDHLK